MTPPQGLIIARTNSHEPAENPAAPRARTLLRSSRQVFLIHISGGMKPPTITCVTGDARNIPPVPHDVEGLLPLALSRPREALARARAVLARQPDPYQSSVAHQAAGIVLRDFGDVEAAVRELRAALRMARRTGLAQREADVLA